MALSKFPERPLDQPDTFKSYQGSFWFNFYQDQLELAAFNKAVAIAWAQNDHNIDELIDSLAYNTIPPLHTELWYPVVVKQSLQNNAAITGHKYGDGAIYGSAGTYGEPLQLDFTPVQLDTISYVPLILNDLVSPTVGLTENVDYTIDAVNKICWLNTNPFNDPRWTQVPVYDVNGNQVDAEITMYFWHAQIDKQLLYRRIGYALGLNVPSTEIGRDLITVYVDALTQGTSQLTLQKLFSIIYDIAICKSTGEVVTDIFTDFKGLVIATNLHVYRYNANAVPVVNIGQVLTEGDSLTNALQFDILNNGKIPSDLSALAIGPGILPASIPGELIFVNEQVPIQVTVPPQ